MIRLTQKATPIDTVFEDNVVPICFSANNSYVSQTAVMIRSIVANALDEKNYDFIILSTDIDEVNERQVIDLGEGKKNISIRIFDISDMIDNVQFFTDSVYTPTTYSKEAYFRLFIPFVMPNYSKVIYFDGDMTATSDVSPLMDIDMTNYMGAATRDYCGIAACYDPGSDRKEYREEIGITDLDTYFISSMVVLNVEMFRKRYTLEYVKNMISSRNWRQHDQDILNILCKDALLIVDAKWSYFEEFDYSLQYLTDELKEELFDAQKNACVVHYAGSNKAWIDDKSPMTSYFWKYASETPYFDEFFAKTIDNMWYKCRILEDYAGKKVDYYYENGNIVLCSTPHYIGRLSDLKVCVEFMKIKNGELFIEGFYETIDILGTLKLFVTLNGCGIPTYNSEEYRDFEDPQNIKKMRNFKVSLSLDGSLENNMVGFGMTYDDRHFVFPSYVSVEQFAPINEYGYSFYSSEDFIITKQEGVRFEVARHSRKKIMFLNAKICEYLRSKKNKYFTKMARVRWLYYLTKPMMRKKNIWLLSGNNSEIGQDVLNFYKYLKTRTDVQPYLVVDEDCKDIRAYKKYGKVLRARSKQHKFYFLHSTTVVASEYNMHFFMPTYVRANEVRDMVANKKMIYWHDGKEDLSYNIRPWYNIYRFIVHDKDTYDLVLNRNNGYTEENLISTNNSFDEDTYKSIFEEINEE